MGWAPSGGGWPRPRPAAWSRHGGRGGPRHSHTCCCHQHVSCTLVTEPEAPGGTGVLGSALCMELCSQNKPGPAGAQTCASSPALTDTPQRRAAVPRHGGSVSAAEWDRQREYVRPLLAARASEPLAAAVRPVPRTLHGPGSQHGGPHEPSPEKTPLHPQTGRWTHAGPH